MYMMNKCTDPTAFFEGVVGLKRPGGVGQHVGVVAIRHFPLTI